MMTPMKIALIGLGHVAAFQIEALARKPVWQIAGAVDLNPERAALLPAGIPFHTDAGDLLDHVDAEACVVATGLTEHFGLGRRVLESGRHLILEKPCCSTLGEFETLLDIAERSCRLLFVALHAAQGLEVKWLAANLAAIAPGRLTSFNCRFSDPYLDGQTLRTAALPLGGSWIDSGINALSVVATLLPADRLSVAEARVGSAVSAEGRDVESTVRFETQPPGCTGRIETRWNLGMNSKTTRLRFAETGIDIRLDHSQECVVIGRQDRSVETVNLKNGQPRLTNHYAGVFDEAHASLGSGRTNAAAALILRRLVQSAADRSRP